MGIDIDGLLEEDEERIIDEEKGKKERNVRNEKVNGIKGEWKKRERKK